MELRDVFAVHAMAALIASPKVNNETGQITDSEYAALAYIVADAMLRQRAVVPVQQAVEEKEDAKA